MQENKTENKSKNIEDVLKKIKSGEIQKETSKRKISSLIIKSLELMALT